MALICINHATLIVEVKVLLENVFITERVKVITLVKLVCSNIIIEQTHNSFAYLTQRLSVAVQRGNAASVLGTFKMDSEKEEFLV